MAQRVLVVEDNADWRAIMALILARLGCTVLQATDGSDAIEKAVSEHPQLIIMDYRMPKMNGLEATTALKGNPVTKDIPVVICTAVGPEAYKNTALLTYAAEIVQKPVKLQVFQALVQKYLGSSANAASTKEEDKNHG
jgi:CheY-like chemotaxis protein